MLRDLFNEEGICMIVLDKKLLIFDTKQIWFSDSVYDIEGCSRVTFRRCKGTGLPGFKFYEEVTPIIDLTQDLVEIWKNMKKDSCRNSIRRAERGGVIIKRNVNVDEFYDLYKAHVKKTKYLRFLEDKSELRASGTLFTAEYNGEVLLGNIYIEDQNHIVYYRGASKIIDDDKTLRTLKGNASHLIQWEAMKYAKTKGIKEFDMGGLWTDSINEFKNSFGGKRVCYPAYCKRYGILYKTASNLGRTVFRYLDSYR
jgi:lipid II:glycine glycyltransferase (peptidoglycan interpeptide bridge formation enzyme)